MIYYNKETRPNVAVTTISGVRELLPSNHWYRVGNLKAYSSREEAIAQDISGAVYFREDNRLYEANSIGSWEFVPLEQEPSIVAGINWNDAYFFTEKAAEEFFSTHTGRWDKPVYDERYDVWRVHYHIVSGTRDSAGSSGVRRMRLE